MNPKARRADMTSVNMSALRAFGMTRNCMFYNNFIPSGFKMCKLYQLKDLYTNLIQVSENNRRITCIRIGYAA